MDLNLSQPAVAAALIAGAVSLVVAVGTLAAGVWRAWSEQRQANRRPFLERQMALCFEASEAASRLATETDPAEWEKARYVARAFHRIFPIGDLDGN